MFGFRADGKRIKGIDPIQKIMPHIMSERSDSQNMCKYDIDCGPLDAYIKEQRNNGLNITYMHLVIASIVRLVALRPRLNRFIMNGRIYKRSEILVSFVVKKALSDNATDSLVKLKFTGKESLRKIIEMVDEAIQKNNKVSEKNGTDKLARVLTFTPNFLIKFLVGFIKFLDKHGMLPKAIINLSPFHTTFFVTNLKSIKCVYIYHHLYNFGTTGLFVSMGKEEVVPAFDKDGNVIKKKVMTLGINTDERFCDGFYFAKTLRMWKRIMENPHVLMEELGEVHQDIK